MTDCARLTKPGGIISWGAGIGLALTLATLFFVVLATLLEPMPMRKSMTHIYTVLGLFTLVYLIGWGAARGWGAGIGLALTLATLFFMVLATLLEPMPMRKSMTRIYTVLGTFTLFYFIGWVIVGLSTR